MNTTSLLLLLLLSTFTAAAASASEASSSSLRGSRELTWGNRGNNKKQRRGCNGRNCATRQDLKEEFQGIKVLPVEDDKNETMVASETQVDTKQDDAVRPPCHKKRGKCAGKRKRADDKVPSDTTTTDPEPKLDIPPCDSEQGDCNGEDSDKKRPTSPQQSAPRTTQTVDAIFLPVCCECKKLPCNCQFDSRQDSLLYRMIHRHGAEDAESTACTGANCNAQGGEGGGVQGALVIPSEESTSVKEASSGPKDPSLMCCCEECTSFPCQCSCTYFTLSRAPSPLP